MILILINIILLILMIKLDRKKNYIFDQVYSSYNIIQFGAKNNRKSVLTINILH